MRISTALIGLSALCAGCNPLIPDRTFHLTAAQSITVAQLLGAAAAATAVYYVVDPLAPNWEVGQTKVADNRWRIAMQKKRFTTGADGEASLLLHRQAERLAQANGYLGYRILAWSEGVQSDMPIAYRWGRGEIELREPAPPMPPAEKSLDAAQSATSD